MEHAVSPVVKLREVDGFFHQPEWYRPLCFGTDIFMYVAHVPAGGEMAPDFEEAKLLETALLMLSGKLEVTDGYDTFEMSPEMSLNAPKGTAFGVKSRGDKTASSVLALTPPPRPESLQEFLGVFLAEGREVLSPEEAEELRSQ